MLSIKHPSNFASRAVMLIESMPDDILRYVCSNFLCAPDLHRLSVACRRLRSITYAWALQATKSRYRHCDCDCNANYSALDKLLVFEMQHRIMSSFYVYKVDLNHGLGEGRVSSLMIGMLLVFESFATRCLLFILRRR